MKSIVPLYLLFFAGTAVSKRVVEFCNYFHKCPSGYTKFYSGATALNSVCLCETDSSLTDPCEGARDTCLSFFAKNCDSVFDFCPPEHIVSLCDVEYFRFPQVCDKAAVKLRADEEDLIHPKAACDDAKKKCSGGQSDQCSEVAKRCGPDSVIELCTSKKITEIATCTDAKRRKVKQEAEKKKYVCQSAEHLCKNSPFDSPDCDKALEVCDSDTIAKLCYKNLIRNQGVCADAIQKTQFLTLEEINEDECESQIEQCKLTSIDGCADVPTVCGKEVVSAMCKASYTIRNALKYNLMCKGIDTKSEYPGCDAFSSRCLTNSSSCKLAERFCDKKTHARLCAAGKLDPSSYKCITAFIQYPEFKNNNGPK